MWQTRESMYGLVISRPTRSHKSQLVSLDYFQHFIQEEINLERHVSFKWDRMPH